MCTPYTPPSRSFQPLPEVVKQVPQFAYQLHLASGEVEKVITTPEQIRQFLNGMYGAKNAEGERCFYPEKGVIFDALPGMGKSRLLSDTVR